MLGICGWKADPSASDLGIPPRWEALELQDRGHRGRGCSTGGLERAASTIGGIDRQLISFPGSFACHQCIALQNSAGSAGRTQGNTQHNCGRMSGALDLPGRPAPTQLSLNSSRRIWRKAQSLVSAAQLCVAVTKAPEIR